MGNRTENGLLTVDVLDLSQTNHFSDCHDLEGIVLLAGNVPGQYNTPKSASTYKILKKEEKNHIPQEKFEDNDLIAVYLPQKEMSNTHILLLQYTTASCGLMIPLLLLNSGKDKVHLNAPINVL